MRDNKMLSTAKVKRTDKVENKKILQYRDDLSAATEEFVFTCGASDEKKWDMTKHLYKYKNSEIDSLRLYDDKFCTKGQAKKMKDNVLILKLLMECVFDSEKFTKSTFFYELDIEEDGLVVYHVTFKVSKSDVITRRIKINPSGARIVACCSHIMENAIEITNSFNVKLEENCCNEVTEEICEEYDMEYTEKVEDFLSDVRDASSISDFINLDFDYVITTFSCKKPLKNKEDEEMIDILVLIANYFKGLYESKGDVKGKLAAAMYDLEFDHIKNSLTDQLHIFHDAISDAYSIDLSYACDIHESDQRVNCDSSDEILSGVALYYLDQVDDELIPCGVDFVEYCDTVRLGYEILKELDESSFIVYDERLYMYTKWGVL